VAGGSWRIISNRTRRRLAEGTIDRTSCKSPPPPPKPSPLPTSSFRRCIDTADIRAERYKVIREYQAESLWNRAPAWRPRRQASSSRTKSSPMKTHDEGGRQGLQAESIVDYFIDRDECNRPDTTMEAGPTEPVRAPASSQSPRANASKLFGLRSAVSAD